jgi:hypothetical protein
LETSDEELIRLVREMRQDLAKLTKIAAKAGRHNRAFFNSFERARFWRRVVVVLLAAIALIMVIQTFIMMGYGPGGDDNSNSQTTQRINLRG